MSDDPRFRRFLLAVTGLGVAMVAQLYHLFVAPIAWWVPPATTAYQLVFLFLLVSSLSSGEPFGGQMRM